LLLLLVVIWLAQLATRPETKALFFMDKKKKEEEEKRREKRARNEK